jgi:tetratricopeptide (TPR) repeat protein
MGSFNSSKKMFEDILEIYRELKSGPSLEYADTLFYYAAMLCSNDEHGEAVTLLEQAVSIYRRINGEDNLATTVCVYLLGSAYFNSESDFLDESVKVLDECLISFRKLLGLTALESDKSIVEPPVIGDVLNMLGSANHVNLKPIIITITITYRKIIIFN